MSVFTTPWFDITSATLVMDAYVIYWQHVWFHNASEYYFHGVLIALIISFNAFAIVSFHKIRTNWFGLFSYESN